MSTRVSLENIVNTTLASVLQSSSNMGKLQEKISSGKEIIRPSDDPAGARKILILRSEELRLDQYASNIKTAAQSLNYNASVL